MILIIYGKKIKFLPLICAGVYLTGFFERIPKFKEIQNLPFYSLKYRFGDLIFCGTDREKNRVYLVQAGKYYYQLAKTLRGFSKTFSSKERVVFFTPDHLENDWLKMARICERWHLPVFIQNYFLNRGLKEVYPAIKKAITRLRRGEIY